MVRQREVREMRRFGTQGPVHPTKNYVVFDHRREPEPRIETEKIDDVTVRSYVIPVVQEHPSAEHLVSEKPR